MRFDELRLRPSACIGIIASLPSASPLFSNGLEASDVVRVHRSLRVTPAMEARVSDRLWSLDELVERTTD
jgi:hypothetical protein